MFLQGEISFCLACYQNLFFFYVIFEISVYLLDELSSSFGGWLRWHSQRKTIIIASYFDLTDFDLKNHKKDFNFRLFMPSLNPFRDRWRLAFLISFYFYVTSYPWTDILPYLLYSLFTIALSFLLSFQISYTISFVIHIVLILVSVYDFYR